MKIPNCKTNRFRPKLCWSQAHASKEFSRLLHAERQRSAAESEVLGLVLGTKRSRDGGGLDGFRKRVARRRASAPADEEPRSYEGLTADDLYHFLDSQGEQPMRGWTLVCVLSALRPAMIDPAAVPASNRALLDQVKRDPATARSLVGETLLEIFIDTDLSIQVLVRDKQHLYGPLYAVVDLMGEWEYHVGHDHVPSPDAGGESPPTAHDQPAERDAMVPAHWARGPLRHAIVYPFAEGVVRGHPTPPRAPAPQPPRAHAPRAHTSERSSFAHAHTRAQIDHHAEPRDRHLAATEALNIIRTEGVGMAPLKSTPDRHAAYEALEPLVQTALYHVRGRRSRMHAR